MFRSDDGILFTTRDGVWPINGGIIGIRDPHDPAVTRFFRRWADRIAAIARDPALVAVARSEKHPYGHVDQMAFAQTIGYERDRRDFVVPECNGLKARAVHGYVLNETRSIPINPDTRILHYKGGWHPILLDGHTFTRHRPMRGGWEMFQLYGDVLGRARNVVAATTLESTVGSMPSSYDSATCAVIPHRYGVRLVRDAVAGCIARCTVSLGRLRAFISGYRNAQR